jgi:hypothetical protein
MIDLTKQDLFLASDLIFNSCIEEEFEFKNVFFIFRTLSVESREKLNKQFKYKSHHYNIYLILKILSNAIFTVNGEEVDKNKLEFLLWNFNSKIILKLYEFYKKLEEKISRVSSAVDYYIETNESRTYWSIFKTCNRFSDFSFVKKLNQFQYYWIVKNIYKDQLEEERKAWSKIEYSTNSICAFINPKAYQKAKNQDSISEHFEDNQEKERKLIIEKLENNEEINEVNTQQTQQSKANTAQWWQQIPGETKEQYEERLDKTMLKCVSGEDIDQFDTIIREKESKALFKNLVERRKKSLIKKEKDRIRGIEIYKDKKYESDLEELKKKGYFYEDISYHEIVTSYDYIDLNKKTKVEIFEKAMNEKIDIEPEVQDFLKHLSSKSNDDRQTKNDSAYNIIEEKNSSSNAGKNESSEYKNVAEKAINIDVDLEQVDILKNKIDKTKKNNEILKNRNKLMNNENLDVMRFD